MRSLRLLAGRASALALFVTSSAAFADVRFAADVGLNGGIASNPYGSTGGNTSSATLTGDFSPSMVIEAPTGDISISGRVGHTEYFKRYSGSTDYGVNASTQHKLSEVTSMSGSFGYNSSIRNGLNPIIDPSILPGPNQPIVVDPTAATGFAQRTETYSANLGLSTSLSARDGLSFSASASRIHFPNGGGISLSYNSYNGSTSYSRTIGATTSIGVSFDLGRVDYAGATNDSTQYSPAATFNTGLSERLSLGLSAGVSISHFNQLTSGDKTSFSGSANLCYTGDLTHLCLTASRRVGGTSLAGTSTITSIGASHSIVLDPRSSLSSNISYSRSRALVGVAGQNSDYVYGTVTYSRQLLQKLSAVLSASYSTSSSSSLVSPRANFSGSLGLRYRLGNF